MPTGIYNRAIGGKKAQPVRFVVSVNHLEVVAPDLPRIWSRSPQLKLAGLVRYHSPGAAKPLDHMLARHIFVGVHAN